MACMHTILPAAAEQLETVWCEPEELISSIVGGLTSNPKNDKVVPHCEEAAGLLRRFVETLSQEVCNCYMWAVLAPYWLVLDRACLRACAVSCHKPPDDAVTPLSICDPH